MVSFSRHRYTIPAKSLKTWLAVIRKYHGIHAATVDKIKRVAPMLYLLDTGKVWRDHAIIAALPTVREHPLPAFPTEDNVRLTDAAEAVEACIEDRLRLGPREAYVSRELTMDACDVPRVLAYVTTRTEITHWFYSKQVNQLLLVLRDRYMLLVETKRVHDTSMGTLDLNDGFTREAFPEWHQYFKFWKYEFQGHMRVNWNRTMIWPVYP